MIKFQKCSDKEKCEKVLVTEMMSTEESSQEEGEEILKIRKPAWRKPIIDDMFKRLDKTAFSVKSPQARSR